MKRLNLWVWAIVGTLACVPASLADEFQLHRDWVGKFHISASVLGGPQTSARVVVPSLLDSVLDDVTDTYTINSLDYADGGQDVNRAALGSRTFTIAPTNFPDPVTFLTVLETVTLDRVEWLQAPSYANVDPAGLSFVSGDSWRASPDAAPLVQPILVRIIGEYHGVAAGGIDVTFPFDETIETDLGQLPEFRFNTGGNYPDSLFFWAARSFGLGHNVDLSIPVGPVTRTLRLTSQFVHVPEPGTIALALIAGAGLSARRVWRRRAAA